MKCCILIKVRNSWETLSLKTKPDNIKALSPRTKEDKSQMPDIYSEVHGRNMRALVIKEQNDF